MSVTKAAQAKHDELFPGHQSTLKMTDPQFVELVAETRPGSHRREQKNTGNATGSQKACAALSA